MMILPNLRVAFNVTTATKGHSEGDFTCYVYFKGFVDREQ